MARGVIPHCRAQSARWRRRIARFSGIKTVTSRATSGKGPWYIYHIYSACDCSYSITAAGRPAAAALEQRGATQPAATAPAAGEQEVKYQQQTRHNSGYSSG